MPLRSWGRVRPVTVLGLVTLLMALWVPASAGHSSAAVVVTGGVAETVRITSTDTLADLRSQLTGGGVAVEQGQASMLELESPDPGAGTCYAVDAEAVVASNVTYDLLVSGAGADHGLVFLAGPAEDYASCARGEPVSDAMFATSESPGRWLLGQTRTANRRHPFTLALVVGPGEDPLGLLADASFTVLARPAS